MKWVLLGLMVFVVAAQGEGYGFVWWADGLRGASRGVYVQTDAYGMAIDTTRANITRFGPIVGALPYVGAAAQSNGVIEGLPEAGLVLEAEVGGVVYRCMRAAAKLDDHANYPVRLIDSGRFLNRIDIQQLEFRAADGRMLEAVARLEIAAWPTSVHLTLSARPKDETASITLRVALTVKGETSTAVAEGNAPAHLTWRAAPSAEASVVARAGETPLPVALDPVLGAVVVDLPEEQWPMAENLDRLDRFSVVVRNEGEVAARVPVVFAFEGSFQGITGMCPVLRDASGQPSGISVQISKNWHKDAAQTLIYEGAWFHAVTEIPVPAGGEWRGELAIAYARWGGLPSVSHSQLSLIGWGGNQRWDECAIGSFGESICYDPDVSLNRAMIDDVRPLMVRSMNDGQWEWTHNVGGGDFLVYFDAGGAKQFLTRMKTAYLAPGPNLSHTVYAGTTADGKIDARIDVQSPRGDEINRAYHRIRYDVRESTPFTRIAFYQLGADSYNDHQFTTIARGNVEGLVEEWQTERGGKRYLRGAMACEGVAPWLALLGGIRPDSLEKGAWADRALVVRSWRARLGGKDVDTPFAAVYGTENGPHSANIELVPPPGVSELLAGDFVEAEIELLILPQRAEDYYGPNVGLREALAAEGGTWKLAHRFAKGNHIVARAFEGVVRRSLPIEITANAIGAAEVYLKGGLGYVPVRIGGLDGPYRHQVRLRREHSGGASEILDQSVHGNDYWQIDPDPDALGKYVATYTVWLGEGEPVLLKFGGAPID